MLHLGPKDLSPEEAGVEGVNIALLMIRNKGITIMNPYCNEFSESTYGNGMPNS